jgi:hypothetical protein
MKSITSMSLALIAFTASMVMLPNASARALSLVGTVETTEDHTVSPPIMAVALAGAGQAMHLGRYALNLEVVVQLATGKSTGTFAIDAGNGDKLTGTVTGFGAWTGVPNEVSIVEILTIVSGTGRFAHATGTITIRRLASDITWNSTGSIEGTIIVPDNRAHHE